MASKVLLFFILVLSSFCKLAFTCGNQCKFRLCTLNGTGDVSPKAPNVLLRAPKKSLTQFVCRDLSGRNEELVKITSTGEATVDGRKISRLSTNFRRDYLRLFRIDFGKGLQGIGRDTTTKAQDEFFSTTPRKCVVLPINGYEVRNVNTGNVRTVASSNPRDCVSFKPITRSLTVECTWSNGDADSADDFDLTVRDPNGNVGVAANDNNVGRCSGSPIPLVGKETLFYKDPIPGTYQLRLKHFRVCNPAKRTTFICRITVDGKLVDTRRGKSNKQGKIVLRRPFNV